MPRPPQPCAPQRAGSTPYRVPRVTFDMGGTLPVPLAALAAPDQATVCTLYQWLQTFRTRLVVVQHDPPALHRRVCAAVADGAWPALFHAVQALGTTLALGTAPLVDAVLHDVRGSFATLACALELLGAGVGVWDDGQLLVRLADDLNDTLARVIPNIAPTCAALVPSAVWYSTR